MAFVLSNFSRQSVALNTGEVSVSGSNVGGPAIFSYRSDTDALATIAGANYFASQVLNLSLKDAILLVGSDDVAWYYVSAIDRDAGTVSLTAV